jgi:tetratricopeptide (TPR) repeat protein
VKPQPARPAPEPAGPPEVAAEPVAAEEFSIAEEPVHSAPAANKVNAPSPEPVHEEELDPFAEISAELPALAQKIPAPVAQKQPPAAPVPPAVPVHQKPAPPAHPEPEFELQQDFELVLEPEPLVPAYDQKPPETPIATPSPVPAPEPTRKPQPAAAAQNSSVAPPAAGFASDQFLADLANEIDQLGIGELTPSFSDSLAQVQAAPPKAVSKPVAPAESGPLKEVFDEFRAELGEMGAEDEDLETHYNLGIAFREMGLLDEAISEFQKVAKATDNGKPFRYVMQCCTLLGLAFMDKGQPGIAAIWYERALHTPGIEPESILALRYDLGVAQESAGEPVAALKSFSQVYAMNIDYRDVADRIAALQKPIR